MLTAICPIFPSSDLHATARFYAGFGFAQIAIYEREGYLILKRDGLEIHFFRSPNHVPERSEAAAYLRTADVDTLAAPIAEIGLPEKGIPRFAPPENKPWGMREADIVDPDGNLLRFGEDLPDG